MLNNIHYVLIPQTIIIVLVLHWLHILDNREDIVYLITTAVVYLTSYLYFQLLMYLFKKRKRMNKKTIQRIIGILYKSYGGLAQCLIIYGIVMYKGEWNKFAFMGLVAVYLLAVPAVYFLVKLTMNILSKIYSK